MARRPPIERLMDKVAVRGADECWTFSGNMNKGYGCVKLPSGKQEAAHRIAYEHFVGPIPDGFDVDHICFNPACCNPKHLEAVPHRENMRRMWRAGRARPSGRRMNAYCPALVACAAASPLSSRQAEKVFSVGYRNIIKVRQNFELAGG